MTCKNCFFYENCDENSGHCYGSPPIPATGDYGREVLGIRPIVLATDRTCHLFVWNQD